MTIICIALTAENSSPREELIAKLVIKLAINPDDEAFVVTSAEVVTSSFVSRSSCLGIQLTRIVFDGSDSP